MSTLIDLPSPTDDVGTVSKRHHKHGTPVEELPLMVMGEDEKEDMDHVPDSVSDHELPKAHKTKSNLKLLLCRLSLLVLGVLLLVLGGLASQYHPHRPLSDYCECDDSSWNGTREWVCGNATQKPAVFGNFTISPTPTSFYLAPTSSYLLPTLSPFQF